MGAEKSRFLSFIIKAIALISAVVFLCVCNGVTVRLLFEAAIFSAKSYLPQNGIAVAASSSAEEEEEVIESFHETEEETTQQTAEKVTANPTDLTVTDSDIAEIIKKAKAESVNDKKDGDINEYTFTDDGVTDSFGAVKVKNVNETQIDVEKKLSEELELSVNKQEPTVLIYHTHTTETYQILDRDFYAQGFLSRSSDESRNMVRVGEAVKEEIEKMGYKVIHDTAVYDNPYTGAYYRSMDAAEAYLEKYPSIQITIDLHRDAIQNDSGVKTKPMAVINGKKAAQIMIITGCQEEGNGITDLPEWEKNLTFALKLQQSMETLFPGLTRPVYFCPRSYNMSITPMSLLIEIGTDANTLEEAVYSGKMLGRAIGEMIADA